MVHRLEKFLLQPNEESAISHFKKKICWTYFTKTNLGMNV